MDWTAAFRINCSAFVRTAFGDASIIEVSHYHAPAKEKISFPAAHVLAKLCME
jgi:hypothetical protein